MTRYLTASLVLLLTAVPALAAPGDIVASYDGIAEVELALHGELHTWTLDSPEPLAFLRAQSPALSDLRVSSVPDGTAVAPGSAIQLHYGGMDRTYVTILRYAPTGQVDLLLKNRLFDKREARGWTLTTFTSQLAEGAETYVSITAREPLLDEYLEAVATKPDTITLDENVVGSTFTWVKVYDQTGMRVDTTGGQPYAGSPTPSGGGINYVQPESAMQNPYADVGGITADQPNPYYNPYAYGGAYLYNPFMRRYGTVPFYAPYPYLTLPGTVYRPVINLGNAFYSPATYFYIVPTVDRLQTNFFDLQLSAGVDNGILILRGADDFIEGEVALSLDSGGNAGFSIRLRGLTDDRGNRYTTVPVIVLVDGHPVTTLIDPNTGDLIAPIPPGLGDTQSLGSRIRIAPANIRTGPVRIGQIEILPN